MKHVFIVGGTSGIGYSLALLYLEKGFVVGICGRDISKISDSQKLNFQVFQTNVSDYIQLHETIETFISKEKKIDIFINCAGSYAEDVADSISYQQAEEMLQTNVLGTVNAFEVACKIMKNQQSGKIAVIASVSGILDYENSSLYTKTKRAVIQIAKAYHRALKPFGISVITIAPGYVDTQKLRNLNANDLSKKPFLIDEKTAANIIFNAIKNDKKFVIFPNKMKWLMLSLSVLPSVLLNVIMFKKAKWMKSK